MTHFNRVGLVFGLAFYGLWITPLPSMAAPQSQQQPTIRVLLSTSPTSLTVTSIGPANLIRPDTGATVASFDHPSTMTFTLSGSSVKLSGSRLAFPSGFSICCAEDSGRLQLNGRSYRGTIRVVVWNNKLACINALPIEEYLWGVVPCEVPDTWPQEVLRAQAVASRTYSFRALEQYPNRPFDVYSTTADQVYHGCSDEADSTTAACEDTLGQICMWDGKPIIAYYSSVAGGWTASSSEAFGQDYPYLRAVPSRDASVYRWTYRISASNLASSLRGAGYSVGAIQRVWVHRFSPEGRVDEIKVIHSNGVLFVGGADLRRILGAANIQSTYFTVEGQAAPDVPGGGQAPTSAPVCIISGGEEIGPSTHPSTLVAVAQVCDIATCTVISAEGVTRLTRMVVLGGDGSTNRLSGQVWVAEPSRAGDIAGSRQKPGIFTLGGSGLLDPEGTLVEDPGGTVGAPSGGSFVFVGQGCGHGVGMSQHGAKILAESGWTSEQILKYFYTGIEIKRSW